MRFRLPTRWETTFLSAIAGGLVSLVGRTLRLNVYNDAEVQRRLAAGEGQILVTWHGRTTIPLYYLRHRGIVIVISDSRDGEIQYRTFRRFGYDAVRGSSGRAAARVTIAALRELRDGKTLTMAPDGPKGPAYIAEAGALYLAWKSGCPLVPAGASARPVWRLNTWDRFEFPRPFSRAAVVFGEPIHVPADTDTADLPALAEDLSARISALQAEADRRVGREPKP